MRLPPLPPHALDADQTRFQDASEQFIANAFSGFTTQRDDGALLGPWTIWIRHPALGEAAQALTAAVGKLDALSPRIHEIVILTVGAQYKAVYELYAHCEVARQAGLSSRQIAALCAGTRPADLSDDETLAYDCTNALAKGGTLPGYLYAAAQRSFGDRGVAHLSYLAGLYAFVCVLLNAYDIPAPELVASAL